MIMGDDSFAERYSIGELVLARGYFAFFCSREPFLTLPNEALPLHRSPPYCHH
jgi:hypothetical protein